MQEEIIQKRPISSRTRDCFPYVVGLVSIAWLPFGLTPSTINLFTFPFTSYHFITTSIGLMIFLAIYLWGVFGNIRYLSTTQPPVPPVKLSAWLTVVSLAALSYIMVKVSGKEWGTLFIYTCAYSTCRLPGKEAIWTVIALIAMPLIGALDSTITWADFLQAFFLVGIVGVIVTFMVQSFRTSQELHMAREELARLAVTTERLRIARDLHDLLGHNLSLIALKSELARRLINTDVARTTTEIQDIEQTARTMLQEVREAVGCYRQPTLVNELQGAQELLAAAGITYHYTGNEGIIDSLPRTVEAVCAWTIREGITNIIRHSHAHQCTISINRAQHMWTVEIINDGIHKNGSISDTPVMHPTGNGLRGLKERVEALAGQFTASPNENGEFCLAVSIPVVTKEKKSVEIVVPSMPLTTGALMHLSNAEMDRRELA